MPGTGAIVAAIEVASGVEAINVGKPEALMFEQALKLLGLDGERAGSALMAGDTLGSDIAGGAGGGNGDRLDPQRPRRQRAHRARRRSRPTTSSPISPRSPPPRVEPGEGGTAVEFRADRAERGFSGALNPQSALAGLIAYLRNRPSGPVRRGQR